MRKVLVILFFVFVRLILVSQNTHVARHSSIDNTGNMLMIGNKFYYVEEAYAYCCTDSINLVCTNLNGQILFKTTQFVRGFYGSLNIKASKDKGILLGWGALSNCDTGPFLNCVAKYDTLGQIAFVYSITAQSSTFNSINFVSANDSSVYLFSESNMIHLSKTGQFLSTVTTTLTPTNAIELLNNGNFIVNSGSNGQFLNSIVNTSLVTILQNTCSVPIFKFAQTSNGIVLGKDYFNHLVSMNASLNQFTITANTCNDFALRGDSVFTIAYTSGVNPIYSILNQSLQAVYSHTSTLSNYVPTGIALSATKIKVVGYANSAYETSMRFNAFYNLNLQGFFSSQMDLALTSATLTNWGHYGNVGSYYLVCDMAVKVKNTGLQPISYFFLNHYEPVFMCKIVFHKKYDVTLMPGDTAVVQSGTFVMSYDARPLNAPPGSAITATPCVFSSVPNGQLDADISNDSFCKAFTVGYVGLNETANINSNVAIFPNPFHDEITITSTELVLHYKLMDVYGSLVQEGQSNDKTLHLKTDFLKTGIYFIQVQTKFGLDTKKLVKE